MRTRLTFLAGLAVGFWPDLETIAGQWQIDRQFTPQTSADERGDRREKWSRALERVKHWEQA